MNSKDYLIILFTDGEFCKMFNISEMNNGKTLSRCFYVDDYILYIFNEKGKLLTFELS